MRSGPSRGGGPKTNPDGLGWVGSRRPSQNSAKGQKLSRAPESAEVGLECDVLPLLLFSAVAVVICYVLVGYPLLLWAAAKLFPRPVRKGSALKSVSIVVPVRDGRAFIREKLLSLLNLDYPRSLLDIFVVSDGSTDGTDDIVRGFAPLGVRLLQVPAQGKAAALNAAFPLLRGEIVLLTDVRQTLDPGSLRCLVACFSDPSVGVASGELVIRAGRRPDENSTGLYWRYESWIRRALSRRDSLLGATGPFYAIRRELAAPIPPDILLDDVYLPMTAVLKGFRSVLAEDAVACDFPASIHAEFWRKLRTQAGVYQLLRALPSLLGPRNRLWPAFWSLKIGRLLLPYLLAVFLVSTLGLPFPWSVAALAPQLAFYLLALVDPWVPDAFPLKRASAASRLFAMLAVAALCGVAVFFVPPQTLWRPTAITPGSAGARGAAAGS